MLTTRAFYYRLLAESAKPGKHMMWTFVSMLARLLEVPEDGAPYDDAVLCQMVLDRLIETIGNTYGGKDGMTREELLEIIEEAKETIEDCNERLRALDGQEPESAPTDTQCDNLPDGAGNAADSGSQTPGDVLRRYVDSRRMGGGNGLPETLCGNSVPHDLMQIADEIDAMCGPRVIDKNGTLIRIGDRVMHRSFITPHEVIGIGGETIFIRDCASFLQLHHPEECEVVPDDSWAKIEEDAKEWMYKHGTPNGVMVFIDRAKALAFRGSRGTDN